MGAVKLTDRGAHTKGAIRGRNTWGSENIPIQLLLLR